MGIGDNPALKLAIFVNTAFTSTAAATLQIQAQGSTDNSNFTVMAESVLTPSPTSSPGPSSSRSTGPPLAVCRRFRVTSA
jgi:hypothetical protein